MTNHQTFLRALENGNLPVSSFNQQTRLYAAWAYHRDYPVREAAARCAYAFSRYALTQGLADSYHHTLTMATLILLYQRIAEQPAIAEDWEHFCHANHDMLTDTVSMVRCHYSADLLGHERARKVFVEPDLVPLPCFLH
ncbi:MAG: hypothetical protein ACRC1E_04145 [Craterilacuibacter sp.]